MKIHLNFGIYIYKESGAATCMLQDCIVPKEKPLHEAVVRVCL